MEQQWFVFCLFQVVTLPDFLSFSGGKCGICGEPYDRAQKLFEKGGRMYTGKIVQVYNQGQEIDVKVKVRRTSIVVEKS